MVQVYLFGGLGNRFFQAIAGNYVAKMQGSKPYLCDTNFESKVNANAYKRGSLVINFEHTISQPIRFPIYVRILVWIIARKPELKFKLTSFGIIISLDVNDDLMWVEDFGKVKILVGFFQNYNFVSFLKPKELTWNQNESKKVTHSHRVGLHMRLGDYALAKNPQGLLPPSYYLAALRHAKVPELSEITIFSDDPKIALEILQAQNFPFKFTIFEPKSEEQLLDEVQVMSECDILICANSSFSLMAGVMNPKRDMTIVPEPFYRFHPFILDSFPDEWVRIKVNWN